MSVVSVSRLAVSLTLLFAAVAGAAVGGERAQPSTGTIAFVSSYRIDPYEETVFEVDLSGGARRITGRDVWMSPDGKLRATVVRVPGGLALSVGATGATGRRAASWKNGRKGKVVLAWSPDSTRVAAVGASSGYVDNGGEVSLSNPGGVWLIRSDGRPGRLLGRGLRAWWSSNGARLAVERTTGMDVRGPDGQLLRRIPRASRLIWSPDGERSAYVMGRSAVVIADGNGKPFRSLAGPPGDAAPTLEWSPAGRALLATYPTGVGELITSDGATRTPFYGIPLGWNGARPRRAPPSIERLVTGDSECWPSLSPDGLTVVLSGCGEAGIYAALSGRVLLRSRIGEPGDDLRWSPNGRKLLQRSGNALETISLPGGIRRTVATFPADAELEWARWLADDQFAYRVSRHTFPRLHLLDLRTLAATGITGLDVRTQPFYEDPWWSPDGAILAARRAARRGQGGAAIVLIEGNTERPIGGAVWSRGRPTWSPDGAAIALVADDETEDDGGNTVVRARSILDGSDRELARIEGALDVAWSPDGKRIAVATSRGVVTVPLARPTEMTFVAPPLSTPARRPEIASPTWSPDGRRVAYTGPPGLVVADSDGLMDPVVLVRPTARPSGPTWSPDGEWIVFAANDPACPDRLRLMIVPSEGGPVTHLYRTPGCGGSRGPAWRPR